MFWRLLVFVNMRTRVVLLKVKEAITRLRNKKKTVRDIGRTLGSPK
uniref:Uncharacterized protein n=2 Tax=Anguilla anguilla TaxID=7936 RepID=A0A0E9TNG4_ANGAN